MLREVIKEAWSAVGGVQNMAQLRDSLSKIPWGMEHGNIRRELAKSRNQLGELMHMNADRVEIRPITEKMNELLY